MPVQIAMPKTKDPMSSLTSALSIYNGVSSIAGGGGAKTDSKPEEPKESSSAMDRKMDTMSITDPDAKPATAQSLESISNPLKRKAHSHGFMPEY